MQQKSESTNCLGFTLIELIIVLTIASILSAFAMPSLHQLKLNKAMDNARDDLFSSLQYARNKAIMIQKNIIVCPSVSKNSCDNDANWQHGWIIFIDKNYDKQFNQNDELLQVGNAMSENLSVTSSIHRNKVRFNAMGFAPGSNISINFCDKRGNDFAKALIVSNSGRVKQSKPINDNVCNS